MSAAESASKQQQDWRELSEDAPEHTQHQFEVAFKYAAIGITLTTPDGKLVSVNPAFCHMLGYSRDELLQCHFQDITHPADVAEGLELYHRLRSGEIDSYTHEKRYLHQDGSIVWAMLSVALVKEAGKVIYSVAQITDLSELKKTKRALKESENRFQAAFDNAAVGMALLDTDGRWLEVNAKLYTMLGYTREDLLSLRFQDITHPDDLVLSQSYLKRQLEDKQERLQWEKRYRHKDGHYIWVLLGVSTIRDANNKVTHLIKQVVDISERKAVEASLQKSEDRFKRLSNATLEGVALSKDGIIRDANESLLRLFRLTRAQTIGISAAMLVAPQDRERVIAYIRAGHDAVYECVCLRGDGTTFDAEVHGGQESDGDQGFRITIIRDISERKQAEEALRATKERYRTILDTVNEGIVLYGKDKSLLGNAQASAILNIDFSQLKFNDSPLHIITEDGATLPLEQEPVTLTLLTGESQNDTIIGITKPGGVTWVEVNTNPFFGADDSIEGVVASFSDVTERQHARELLAAHTEALEQSNRDLQDFAYVASHDLQEPLRMVSSYLQLLEQRYAERLEGDGLEFLNYAVDGARRMQQLIRDLLSYSRIQTQGRALTAVDLNAVWARVLHTLEFTIQEHNAQISNEPLPTLRGDATQLEQLLQNLISNALKFTATLPEIHLGVKETKSMWQLSVSDNGIGMDEKSLERIFTIFQRLHNRDTYDGTGIGLAICRRIAERHGGKIWAESTPGQGATFHVLLPK